jgi:hypothetical protein
MGTFGDATHLHKIYRMSLIVLLCKTSFDHHHLGTAGVRTFKIWRYINCRWWNFLSGIAKSNQPLKKLQCDALKHSSIELFPSENKCNMILTTRFMIIAFFVSKGFCWIRQRLQQNFFPLGDVLRARARACVIYTNRQTFKQLGTHVMPFKVTWELPSTIYKHRSQYKHGCYMDSCYWRSFIPCQMFFFEDTLP